MNCPDAKAQLFDLIDRSDAAGPLARHVRECPSCGDALLALRESHERLSAAAARSAAPDAAPRVMSRIAAAAAPRRTLFASRVARWATAGAIAAAIVFGLGLVPWGPGRGGNAGVALARLAARVQETRTVAFRLRMEVEGATTMTGELVDAGDLVRMVEGGRIGIGDRSADRAIIIDPAARTWQHVEPLPPFPAVYDVVRNLRPGDGPVQTRVVAGRTVLEFRARVFERDALILADAESGLPIHMEWEQPAPLPGGQWGTGRVIADDFEWDEPIDEARLDMTPPAGYAQLPTAPAAAPAVPAAAEDFSIEQRVARIVFACVCYGNLHDGCWPESLADLGSLAPHGLLTHPDRPQRPIGYGYVKPSGRTTWEPREQRRVIAYELFDEWPGAAVVGYSDSTTERITEQPRFDELLADARRRGGRPGSPTAMENRVQSIAFACLTYAGAHDGAWPEDLAQVAPFVFAGALRSPNLPGEEVGFAYVRPSGPPRWSPPAERRLLVHERFSTWPGQVAACFTDGSAEMIGDRARLEALIREAGERGD